MSKSTEAIEAFIWIERLLKIVRTAQ